MKNKAQEQGIPESHYTKDYYFSGEYYGSANEYKLFTKGGKPATVYLRALSYLQNISSGKFLDVGCGRGELVLHLARLGRSAIGIDYSKSAIEICQDTLIKEKAPVRRLGQFKLANVTNLPFKDETFDAVFMLDVIEHLTKQDTEKALSELKRVLKKGGRIIVHTNNKFFERGTKLFITASYHGLKAFLHPKKYLLQPSHPDHPYEYMHINYITPTWLARYLRNQGFQTKTEYVKPNKKSELQNYVDFLERERWKKLVYYNIVWAILNSPLLLFFSPTFWLAGTKIK
ncbi:MAG: class I SAM-dependent methyltransferase [Thermoproteota archaeon]|nr:class I SAM-dependent methyltransferase [Thermoproteota archaeon]